MAQASDSVSNGAGATSNGQLQLVTFELAGEEFAVDILAVHEIKRMMELTRVPQSPPDVDGVINLRGKIIPVVDLRRKFGFPVQERTSHNRIIVVEVAKRVLGFIVDRVNQPLYLERARVEPAPAMVCSIESDFIAGVGKLEDRLIILLDMQRLFRESVGSGSGSGSGSGRAAA
jgi:purine-binding chemotaxis protein CheW